MHASSVSDPETTKVSGTMPPGLWKPVAPTAHGLEKTPGGAKATTGRIRSMSWFVEHHMLC